MQAGKSFRGEFTSGEAIQIGDFRIDFFELRARVLK
jgi:hypothetical protein